MCGVCLQDIVDGMGFVWQEDYEVTPDEKRKSRGDQIIKTYLSKDVGSY